MRSRNVLLWQSCAGKTTATRGALIHGGKRLCSLGNDELLSSAFQLSSSREGEWTFISKAKITAESRSSPALWGTNGCWLRGLHENRRCKKGSPFPNVCKHWSWNPHGICVSRCLRSIQPSLTWTVFEAQVYWSQELSYGGWSCSCVTTNFNNFMLVYIKWNFGSWRSLHNQNQLMPALTVSAKKSWSESPRSGINNFKTLLQHWLNFMEGLNGNNIELESLELGLLLQSLTCQCQTRRDTQKQMLHGPSSACAVPAP